MGFWGMGGSGNSIAMMNSSKTCEYGNITVPTVHDQIAELTGYRI
jgi:hypothetical protein